MRRQFQQPSGFFGRIAGRLMAMTNTGINRLTVDLLEVQPADHVLEIGFGPGTTVEMIAKQAVGGFVAGIDPSEVMVQQASERNQRFIDDRRVELRLGASSQVPYEDARFDKVCSVNTFYFWPEPEADLREIHRVMKDGGRCILSVRTGRDRSGELGVTNVSRRRSLEEVRGLLQAAGFRDVREDVQRTGLMTVACVIGQA